MFTECSMMDASDQTHSSSARTAENEECEQSVSSSDSSETSPEPEIEAAGGRDIPGARSARSTSDTMSASYHEIFDTQMPPESAPHMARLALNSTSENEEEADLALSPGHPNLKGLTLCDQNTAATTQAALSPLDSPIRKPHSNKSSTGNLLEAPSLHSSLMDPNLLIDMENDARHLATSVDNLVESLSGTLQSISALTVDTMDTYKEGVCKTCDEVDGNIKAMYQLMAKVEELNKAMGPAYKLGEELKTIKKLLEMYENAANSK